MSSKPLKVKDMSDQDIEKFLSESRKELMSLRFNYAVSRHIQNPARISLLKKGIAKALTFKREKEISALGGKKKVIQNKNTKVETKDNAKSNKTKKISKELKK